MTPELKAKLLRYANECEPFTAHNHIEITDIGEGRSSDVREHEPLGPAPRRHPVHPGG